DEDDGNPAKWKGIGEFNFAQAQNASPREHGTGKNCHCPREPPRKMQPEEDMARNVVVAMGSIRFPGEMNEPFAQSEMSNEIRHPQLQPNRPRRGDEEKNQDAVPA